MEISNLKSGLLIAIKKYNGKQVGFCETRINYMAQDCLNAIHELETEITVLQQENATLKKALELACKFIFNEVANKSSFVSENLLQDIVSRYIQQAAEIVKNYVEVVRCEDCDYFIDCEGGLCDNPKLQSEETPVTQKNRSCSYGERKDGVENV